MSNEQYLQVSYFVVLLLCVAAAIVVILFLRRPFEGIIARLSRKNFAEILRKLFWVGILFPALAGFFSVSFYGCSKTTYADVISKLPYLVEINQEQLAASLSQIVYAIFIWSVIILLLLWILARDKPNPS